jgi:serine/threonine-protein kinase
MPETCPRCDAPVQPDAPSCGNCEYVLGATAGTFLTVMFPVEHPDYDTRPVNAHAPAPTLMPGPRIPEPRVPEEDRRATMPAVVGAVAFVIVVGIVVTVALLGGRDGGGTSEALPGGQTVVATSAPEQDSPDLSSSPPVPTAPTDETSAQRMLQDQVANDRAEVEQLTERWVPQLSSKQPGLKVNGTIFDYQAIWADFASLAERYPGAMLLWSGDYSSFRLPDFWVTIAPQAFDSGQLANGWCDSAGIDRDNCYAKRITHTGGYTDSTLLRP